MQAVQLKLKQASAGRSGVPPKGTARTSFNSVSCGLGGGRIVFWFELNLLLQAKVAFYVKASLRPTTEYLALLTKEVSRVDLFTTNWDDLLLTSSPGKGRSPIEIKIPLGELKKELEEGMPLAEAVCDLPRGRKRPGWKKEFLATLRQAGDEIGEISEQDILKKIKTYRSERKKPPEIKLVAQAKRTA